LALLRRGDRGPAGRPADSLVIGALRRVCQRGTSGSCCTWEGRAGASAGAGLV